MPLIAKIEDSFDLSQSFGSCVVLFSFISDDMRLHVGDAIQLRTPTGREMNTSVGGFPSHQGRGGKFSMWLPPDIVKQDVPPGTEIWRLKD